MLIWVSAFVIGLFTVGLPTDPVYAFGWIWTGTVAWRIERPWRTHVGFLRDWAPLIVLLALYNMSRGIADDHTSPHATAMIHVDEWLWGRLTGGEIPTLWLQQHLYDAIHIHWYDTLASLVYFSHFVTALTVATVLWLRNRKMWASFVRRWFTLTALGLTTYYLYPAAPPWWAAKFGMIAPVDQGVVTRGWSALGLHSAGDLLADAKLDAANPVAAMPSLHSAYALLVILFFLPRVRKRWWPLMLAYPLAMAFTLVYAGEHYTLDVLVGWLYVAVTYLVVWAAEQLWAAYRSSARSKTANPPASAARPHPPASTGRVGPPGAPTVRNPTPAPAQSDAVPVVATTDPIRRAVPRVAGRSDRVDVGHRLSGHSTHLTQARGGHVREESQVGQRGDVS